MDIRRACSHCATPLQGRSQQLRAYTGDDNFLNWENLLKFNSHLNNALSHLAGHVLKWLMNAPRCSRFKSGLPPGDKRTCSYTRNQYFKPEVQEWSDTSYFDLMLPMQSHSGIEIHLGICISDTRVMRHQQTTSETSPCQA
jgi:hypothetical protein